MKILVMSKPGRMEKYIKDPEFFRQFEITVIPFDSDDDRILESCPDADIMVVDAIAKVSGNVIRKMKNLKMIHSEGVGYNGIDVKAATECGVYVCNGKAMNATAVAEQAVLLMLGLLRGVITGDRAVREGRQMEVKAAHMVSGDLKEIADCRIGFVGFGDVAKATAKLCAALGAEMVYNDIVKLPKEKEEEYRATFVSLPELLKTSDIVSIHVPVTPETTHMVNREFLSEMKEGAYFINTARGELVVAEDLLSALKDGHLAGAGLDCIEGEPVSVDNAMFKCDPETSEKIIYSPHVGGITASSFKRGYEMVYEDILAVARGEKPKRCVNL